MLTRISHIDIKLKIPKKPLMEDFLYPVIDSLLWDKIRGKQKILIASIQTMESLLGTFKQAKTTVNQRKLKEISWHLWAITRPSASSDDLQ